jgi:hypothetical protein
MMNSDRVKLSSIRALTFYAGERTAARRTVPVPQLVCAGAPCKRYTPDVVRCENAGGAGADVDWTCRAELPASIRFGRVNVGCEGWARPGDEYVLKGACAGTYHWIVLIAGMRRLVLARVPSRRDPARGLRRPQQLLYIPPLLFPSHHSPTTQGTLARSSSA